MLALRTVCPQSYKTHNRLALNSKTSLGLAMDDLFASAPVPEKVLSNRFRVHPVIGDAFEPSLKGGRDYVLTAPVTCYQGEGVYLVDAGLGIELYRVTNILGPNGDLMLSRENAIYLSHPIERAKFNDMVVGIVVADVRIRNEGFLTSA